jgi:RsiW-degrading membrane proteinase PrsW (M82 family)
VAEGALWLLLPAAAAGAGAWIVYFRWKDRAKPEPWTLQLATVAVGGLAVGAALLGYHVADAFGPVASWEALAGPWSRAVPAALVIGTVEEAAKLLPVLPIALASRQFDELWDGPVYAGASAVGFALAETALLAANGELGLVDGLARAVAAPITHAVFAAPWGLGLAHFVLRRDVRALALGFAASAGVHGLYDLLLARPGLQLAAAGVVLLVWVWMLWIAPRLAHPGGPAPGPGRR